MVPIALVYSIHDSTAEVAIQKMIDASQRILAVQGQVQGEAKEEGWGINPVMKRHLELEIKTLQNAPRDADKLRRLLEVKQRQKDEAEHIEDTQRLVTEIEMLKVVLHLISRDN
jgi:methyl coenzyme M reductase beta subunit